MRFTMPEYISVLTWRQAISKQTLYVLLLCCPVYAPQGGIPFRLPGAAASKSFDGSQANSSTTTGSIRQAFATADASQLPSMTLFLQLAIHSQSWAGIEMCALSVVRA